MLRNIARKIAAALLCAGLAIQFAQAADEGVKRDSKASQLPAQNLQGSPMPFNIQMPPTRPKEDVRAEHDARIDQPGGARLISSPA
jgi:hypothetical protein